MRLKLTLLSLLFCTGLINAQIADISLVPGGSPNTVDVQLTVTSQSFDACTDFLFGLGFSVIFDNASGITNVSTTNTAFDCGCGVGYALVADGPYDVSAPGYEDRTGFIIGADAVFPCSTPLAFEQPIGVPVTIATLLVEGGSTPEGALGALGLRITDVGDPGIPAGQASVWEAFVQSAFTGLWTVNVIEGSLPLTLLSFEANKKGDRSVNLSWSTADEVNTSHFVIERSRDGKEWEDIGSVEAAGESSAQIDYTFVDKNAYNGRSAQARFYYRLRMVDKDAKFTRSEIEAIVFKGEGPGSEVYAYPNPSSIGLNVEFNAEDRIPSRMELFDASGRVVYSTVLAEGTEIEYIDYSRLSITSGTYILRVLDENDATMTAEKIIVSR